MTRPVLSVAVVVLAVAPLAAAPLAVSAAAYHPQGKVIAFGLPGEVRLFGSWRLVVASICRLWLLASAAPPLSFENNQSDTENQNRGDRSGQPFPGVAASSHMSNQGRARRTRFITIASEHLLQSVDLRIGFARSVP